MGYNANGNGYVTFKEVLNENQLNKIKEVIEDWFEFEMMREFNDNRTGKTSTNIDVWRCGKYYDDISECLEEIGKIAEMAEGDIKFTGEDGSEWQFVLRDGKWAEENGYTRYCDEADKVYVYKVYNDGLAYGEESIRLFNRKADALDCLKKDIKHAYSMILEEMKEDPEYRNDTIEPERVIITNDGGDTSYFIVQALPLE